MTDTTTTEVEEGPPPPRPFSRLLAEQRKGALHVQLSETLRDATNTVIELGKKAQITLVIGIVPSKDGETISITDQVKVKLPEPEAGSSTFFVNEHGDLSRTNPVQDELPLREVAAAGAERRLAGGDAR